jgi:Holliday junction resolvasome RuvABC endonuclease subunit
MVILGLDPSLSAYGFAILKDTELGLNRRVYSKHEATLPSRVPVARFMHFRALVDDMVRVYQPDLIGIESPAYDAGVFQTIHFGLLQYSLEAAFLHRKDVVLFDPATLKSLVKGTNPNAKGIMTKLDMQKFVMLDTMDTKMVHDGEADAYCLAYFASRFYKVLDGTLDPADLNPSEYRIFLGKTKTVKTVKGNVKKRTGHAFRENNRFYRYSAIPPGSVDLPRKNAIRPELLKYLEEQENAT